MEGKIQYVSPFKRALYLKRVAPLRNLSPDQLALVAQQARERFFARGAVIHRSGDALDRFHIVVDGRIAVRSAEHGDTTLRAEETLGLLTLLARWQGGLDAVADVDTRTLEIHADDLYEVFEDHFTILHNEIRTLASRTLEIRKNTPTGAYFAPRGQDAPPPERELDLIDRLQYLRRGPIFRNANIDVLLELANRTQEAHFEPGVTLWEVGNPSGYLYALVSGNVRCTLPDGGWFRCGPGYPLGNLESQCGAPRWYEAVTETPVVAMRNKTDTFLDMLEDHFEMAREFLAAMATGLIRILVEERERKANEEGAREAVGGD
ncbi:MAG: cyclic nucleotide-binding domain-containing protein [Candidatus Latescibacterota bacterium]|nr:MAG: cyclic nucleotide-binding domain-containing protein [Candidatus Latescibacterota bacterium]